MLQDEDEKKKKNLKKMIDLRIEIKPLSVNLLRIRDNQLHQSTAYNKVVVNLRYILLSFLILATINTCQDSNSERLKRPEPYFLYCSYYLYNQIPKISRILSGQIFYTGLGMPSDISCSYNSIPMGWSRLKAMSRAGAYGSAHFGFASFNAQQAYNPSALEMR